MVSLPWRKSRRTTTHQTRDRGPSQTWTARYWKWAANRNLLALKNITLAQILAGDTCEPIALEDLEGYMAFQAHCLENLQFIVWYQSYRKRFFALPLEDQMLSPGPDEGTFNFGMPNRVELDYRAGEGREDQSKESTSCLPKRLQRTHPIPPPLQVRPTLLPSPINQTFGSPTSTTDGSTLIGGTISPGSVFTSSQHNPKVAVPPIIGEYVISLNDASSPTPLASRFPVRAPTLSPSSSSRVVSTSSVDHSTETGETTPPIITKPSPPHSQSEMTSGFPFIRVSAPTRQPMRTEALNIVATFFRPGSPKELALDAAVRDTVLRNLVWNTHPDVFLPAYEHVFDMVETQIIQPFLLNSSANINRPKQLFWYIFGIFDLALSLLIALLLIAYVPPTGGRRAYRLFTIIPAWLGCTQFYAATRGFCTQVYGRNATQLRVWELKSIDEEDEISFHHSYGSGRPGGANAREYWEEVKQKEFSRVYQGHDLSPVLAASHGPGPVVSPKSEFVNEDANILLEDTPLSLPDGVDLTPMEKKVMAQILPRSPMMASINLNSTPNLRLDEPPALRLQTTTTKPVGSPTPSSPVTNTPLAMEKATSPISLDEHALQRDLIAPFYVGHNTRDDSAPQKWEESGGPGSDVGSSENASAPGFQRTSTLTLTQTRGTKGDPEKGGLGSGESAGHGKHGKTDATPKKTKSRESFERRRPGRNGYRRPPVFGPEKVVKDPRILALHDSIVREILTIGTVYALVFVAIVLGVPGMRR